MFIFRDLEKTSRKIADFRNHLRFSLRCLKVSITPTSLRLKTSIRGFNANKIIFNAERKLLNERVRQINYKLDGLNARKSNLEKLLREKLSDEIFAETKEFITRGQLDQHEKGKDRQKTKFDRLQQKKTISAADSDPNWRSNSSEPKTTTQAKTDESNITREERTALKDLATNQDILILPADKGRCTVVLDREQYDRKVQDLLGDKDTFMPLKKDPTNKFKGKISSALKKLQTEGVLDRPTYLKLNPTTEQPPAFYGLPKIHKQSVPLRPIVSSIGSVTYELAGFLAKILGPLVGKSKKGDLSNCNNWRGITLLSIPGKVFCAVLLRRLKKAVDCLLREEQAGFRSNRSCTEQIFTLRNIIEQCLEHQTPLALNFFIDFKKAFDSIHRETLWNIALSYGIPARFVRIFKSLYENSRCCVRTEGGTTDFFNIITGVRQGCILSPFLFLITIDFVLRKTTGDGKEGIRWREESRLADLDFADDLALLSENNQGLTTKLETSSGKVGLRVSSEKTKAMEVGNHTGQPLLNIIVNNSQVEVVDQFTYLGSVISNSGEVEPDINCRVGKAASVFRRMNSIWSATTINLDTKLRLYNSIVLPTAIYASETWKCTAKASRKLDAFHQRNLRRILKVRWQDHITNDEILNRAKSKPLSTIITEKRMQLTGHILRLPSRRHSKTAMTWVPHNGRRKRGRPKHTWRRTFQDDLRRANIPGRRRRQRPLTKRSGSLLPDVPYGTGGTKNSADFVNKIKDIHVEDDETITSYDVCSLFTSIPPKEAVSVVKEALEADDTLADRTNLSVDQVYTKTIVEEDGNLRFEVYRKPTHTDQYLAFDSHHPLEHKLAVIKTLFHRADNIVTSDQAKTDEQRHLRGALAKCGYQNWTFNKALKPSDQSKKTQKCKPLTNKNKANITIPYVQGVSEKLRRIFQNFNIATNFKPHSTLRQRLVHPKDRPHKGTKANVIYRLKCEEPNCNNTYIGETSRPLKVRYKEHCRPSANGYSSAIFHHLQHNQGHSFKLESTDVLDRETRWEGGLRVDLSGTWDLALPAPRTDST
ncbi:hypothetical protein Bbelb_063940 [Branchiostoma belcheri]|nr:hypothetical protein Bbelb_063940 [Branchiostoma belcheri]